jgi:hypothetical protein
MCVFMFVCSTQVSLSSEQQIHQVAEQGQGKAQYELVSRLAAKPGYI